MAIALESNRSFIGPGAARCSPRLLGIFIVLIVLLAAMILTAEPYTGDEDGVPTAAPLHYQRTGVQQTTLP